MAFIFEHLQRTYGKNGRHEPMNGFTLEKIKENQVSQ